MALESTSEIERLVFVWWNTGLSPVRGQAASLGQKQVAAEIVKAFMETVPVDCLALGEVTRADLRWFVDYCSLDHVGFFDGTRKVARLQFDTGLLYNKSRLELLNGWPITIEHGTRRLKLANRIDFYVPSSKTFLHVFLSHWPSRRPGESNKRLRDMLGLRLKDKIREDTTPAVILLGDYNEEPFDISLADNLLATRDRELAQREDDFVYNPFWRHLGESFPYNQGKQDRSFSGTCFSRSEPSSRWRTFDQIIFSRTFLGEGVWHLNEELTQVMHLPALRNLIGEGADKFDHFPVIGVIERSLEGELANG